jgi:hypothetical protein
MEWRSSDAKPGRRQDRCSLRRLSLLWLRALSRLPAATGVVFVLSMQCGQAIPGAKVTLMPHMAFEAAPAAS